MLITGFVLFYHKLWENAQLLPTPTWTHT